MFAHLVTVVGIPVLVVLAVVVAIGVPEAAYMTRLSRARRNWRCGVCRRCMRRNVVDFSVPDDVWLRVVGLKWVCLCLSCFDEEAQLRGVKYELDARQIRVVTWAQCAHADKESRESTPGGGAN